MRAVNLIPAEQRAGSGPVAGRSDGAAYAVLALLGGFALFAFLYGSARHEISSRRARVASLTAEAQQTQAAATQLAPYTTFIAMNQQREQAVSELAQSRFDWAQAFHELGRVLPVNASITSVSGTIGSTSSGGATTASGASGAAGSSTVASATPPGSVPVITLTGCSTSQSGVAQTLNRLRLIDGVSAVTLQSSALGGAGSASSGGSCAPTDASFSAELTFEALPAVSSTGSTPATATTSNGGGR